MEQGFDALRFRLVAGRLPRPMRRVEMKAEQKRLLGFRVVVDNGNSAFTQKVRQITVLLDLYIAVPKIVVLLAEEEICVCNLECAAAEP
jgi:hypothetical protein